MKIEFVVKKNALGVACFSSKWRDPCSPRPLERPPEDRGGVLQERAGLVGYAGDVVTIFFFVQKLSPP